MKKKIKRLFSIVLAAIMIVSVSTVNAKAASYPAVFFMGDESFEEVTVTQTAYVGDVVPIRMEWFCEYNNEGYELNIYDSDGYTNSSVTGGNTYYYKVKAVKNVNGTDWTSDYSNVVSKKR